MFAVLRAVALIFATIVAVLVIVDGSLMANLFKRE